MLAAAVLALSACAGKQHRTAGADAGGEAVAAKHGDGKGYRFDMTQHGKKMSADDFDAWMKANGLSVAKGDADAKRAKGKKALAARAKRD